MHVEHCERDDGVGRPGHRIADRARDGLGIDRPGDVPDADGSVVDARGDDPFTVRRPPVASAAIHLLGGDEVGQTPRDVGIVVVREQAILAAPDIQQPQRTVRDVGHAPPGRIRPRVERRAGRGLHLPSAAADQVGQEQPIPHRDGGRRERAIRRVRGHPRERFPQPFAAVALFVGDLLVALHLRTEDQPLLRAVDVEDPEVPGRIVARARPEERHPRPVACHRDRPRAAERVVPGAGLLPRERVGRELRVGHRRLPQRSELRVTAADVCGMVRAERA